MFQRVGKPEVGVPHSAHRQKADAPGDPDPRAGRIDLDAAAAIGALSLRAAAILNTGQQELCVEITASALYARQQSGVVRIETVTANRETERAGW